MQAKPTPVRKARAGSEEARRLRRDDFLGTGQDVRRRLVDERRGPERTRKVTFAPESLALKNGWDACERLSDKRFNPLSLYITELYEQHASGGVGETNRPVNGEEWQEMTLVLPGMRGKTIRWDAEHDVYCVRDLSIVKTENPSKALLNGYCDTVVSMLAGFERSSYSAQKGVERNNAFLFDKGEYSAIQEIQKVSTVFYPFMFYAAAMRHKLLMLGGDPGLCGFTLDEIPIELRAVCILEEVDVFGDPRVNATPTAMLRLARQ